MRGRIVKVVDAVVDERWPVCEPPPPRSAYEAGNGSWSAAARGVEIQDCVDDPQKGKGVFAIRKIHTCSVIGVYWGEHLTSREFSLRHGSADEVTVVASPAELEALGERIAPLLHQPASGDMHAVQWDLACAGQKNGT